MGKQKTTTGTTPNGLQVFQNEEFGQVRTIARDGEPWFVAADVCKALEVGNPAQALTRLDDDEKDIILNDTPGGEQKMSIVNEPGLYTLVLGSRKTKAKTFKRWITHEVIPSIRKTGSYHVSQTEENTVEKIRPTQTDKEIRAKAMLLNAQTRQFAAITKGIRDRAETLRIAAVVYGLKELAAGIGTEISTGAGTGKNIGTIGTNNAPNEVVNEQAPQWPANRKDWSATEVGKMYGITANKVGRLAIKYKLKTEDHGFWKTTQCPHNSTQVQVYRYNRRGAEKVGELLAEAKRVAA